MNIGGSRAFASQLAVGSHEGPPQVVVLGKPHGGENGWLTGGFQSRFGQLPCCILVTTADSPSLAKIASRCGIAASRAEVEGRLLSPWCAATRFSLGDLRRLDDDFEIRPAKLPPMPDDLAAPTPTPDRSVSLALLGWSMRRLVSPAAPPALVRAAVSIFDKQRIEVQTYSGSSAGKWPKTVWKR